MNTKTGSPRRDGLRAFFLVGPTAAGKTAVAHMLAATTGREIVSADSMAVYRRMDIGTAKPTPAERAEVPYHCLDLAEPSTPFSVWEYRNSAMAALRDAASRGRTAIVCGGSGLYVKSLTHGLDRSAPAAPDTREYWEKKLRELGVDALREHLGRVAPAILASLADPDNPRRLLRAIEQAEAPSSSNARSWRTRAPTAPLAGLRMSPRLLHNTIDSRVRSMYSRGLVDEARRLREDGARWSRTAMQAIGYAEAIEVLDGRLSEAEAIDRTILRTRQLAKRQMTWFRRQASVEWIDVDTPGGAQTIAARVASVWEEYGPVDIAEQGDA